MQNIYIFAHLTKWNDEEEYIQVGLDNVDEIVNAVQTQNTIDDTKNKIHFDGSLYKKIEILLVDKKDYESVKKELYTYNQERKTNETRT